MLRSFLRTITIARIITFHLITNQQSNQTQLIRQIFFRTPQVNQVGGQPQPKLPRYRIMSANSTHNDKTFTLMYTTTNRAIFDPNPKRHGTLNLIKELSSHNGVTVHEKLNLQANVTVSNLLP